MDNILLILLVALLVTTLIILYLHLRSKPEDQKENKEKLAFNESISLNNMGSILSHIIAILGVMIDN